MNYFDDDLLLSSPHLFIKFRRLPTKWGNPKTKGADTTKDKTDTEEYKEGRTNIYTKIDNDEQLSYKLKNRI